MSSSGSINEPIVANKSPWSIVPPAIEAIVGETLFTVTNTLSVESSVSSLIVTITSNGEPSFKVKMS